MAIENTIPSSLQDVLASQENARIDRDKQHQEEMTTMRNILIQQRNNHPSSSSSTSSSERNTEHKNINVLKQSTLDLNMQRIHCVEGKLDGLQTSDKNVHLKTHNESICEVA